MNSLSWLWLVPLFTYGLSYVYLAWYHHKIFLFCTVIHEGGGYTFLQTLFYASHFLGHVPMLTVLACLFTGSMLCLASPEKDDRFRQSAPMMFSAILLFLGGSMILSGMIFGRADTWAFISQQKQSVVTYGQGGSWNLHLPSTFMQFFLMPVYVYVVRKILRRPVNLHIAGAGYVVAGIVLLVAGTMAFNKDALGAVVSIAQDPRYLAHSVRELATFPLIFYPLPLYVILKFAERPKMARQMNEGWLLAIMACLSILFLMGFWYQAWVPLSHGIASLAQKPEFAHGKGLSVAYLLASHYFEHFLDAIYFTLVCVLFYAGFTSRQKLS
jgi:hypothetical protein